MGIFGSKPVFSMKTDEQLWYEISENLEYPWFAPKMQVFESGGVQDMCGEDVSFCLDAKEAGIETW